jgi:DNA mismatch repair protein MSH5
MCYEVYTANKVGQIQSTFMIDLQQMSLLLNLATEKSLIVIDEFGKGTDINGEKNTHTLCFKH